MTSKIKLVEQIAFTITHEGEQFLDTYPNEFSEKPAPICLG